MCVLPIRPSIRLELIVTQSSVTFTTVGGTTVDYNSLAVASFVEEDGQLKILEVKEFCDPQERNAFHAATAKTPGGPAV